MSMRAVGPRYAEIANELKQRILSGLYSQTGFLPQERQLSEEFGVSRCTLRSALECLQEEKLICKIQGCGNRIVAGTSALPRYIGILTYGIGSVSRFVNVMLQEIEHFVRDRGQITLLLKFDSGYSEPSAETERYDGTAAGGMLSASTAAAAGKNDQAPSGPVRRRVRCGPPAGNPGIVPGGRQ